VINPVEPHGGPSGYGTASPQSTNGTAVAALVFSIVLAPVGIVLGYVARSQIKRTGEAGGGMATAALIIGWVLTVLGIVVGVIAALFVALGYFVTETLPNWL
jgi:peptidyl-prolyl cis-trans isomerase B (cyclophilin B)